MIGKDTKVWRYSAKQNCTKAGAYFCYFDTIEYAVVNWRIIKPSARR